MRKDYHDTQLKVAAVVRTALDDLKNKFGPIPEEDDNTWFPFLIDLLTVGTLLAVGPFFNNFLKTLPYIRKAAQRGGVTVRIPI